MNTKIQQSLKIQIKSVKKCLKCSAQLKDQVEEYHISVPLSVQKQLVYQVVFVPICKGLKSSEIKRYGLVLPQGATLKQLKQEFEKVAQLDKKRLYVLAQVYSNKIIKNYNSVQLDTPLEKLKLRNGDYLYAFELYVDFTDFISHHYSSNKSLTSKDVKVDNFIDCKHHQKGWIFGKVCEVQYLPYTQQTLIKVHHKFSKDQQWQIKYDFNQQNVAKYPLRCHSNAEQYHLQINQRYFNEAVNQMQSCNMPLVIVLTSWMRWKQFNFLVYLQMRRFICQAQSEQDINQQDEQQLEDMPLISSKDIKSSKKIMNSHKKSKFKEYLNGSKLPYKIHLTDSEGRCAICFKFLKSSIFKGESQNYCEGCKLSQSEPISWQIKVSDLIVCIDWKDIKSVKTSVLMDHSSLLNMKSNKRGQAESLMNCLSKRFDPYIQEEELLCCNIPQQVSNKEWIQNSPQVIPIYLSRIVEQEDGYKKINTLPVSYPLKGLILCKSQYNLMGITAIQGNNKNIKYKTFVLKEGSGNLLSNSKSNQNEIVKKQQTNLLQEWVEYDGEHTRTVDASYVQKSCALVLFYKKSKV